MFDDALFIVNPISGNGRKNHIVRKLKDLGCNIVFTKYAGHAVSLASNAMQGIVVAVGGDGTVNEVARGLMGTDKKMGIIPCGSGDGLALCLGISRKPYKALKAIEMGNTVKLDCASIDGKPFFSVCGVGFDADVAQNFANSGKRGLETYIASALELWAHHKPEHYEIDIDGDVISTDALMITVANSNQWGNGAKVAPLARPDDGLLDVTIVKDFPGAEIPILSMRLMTGKFAGSRRVQCLKGRSITIHRSNAGAAHCDGDVIEAGDTINISILPQKIDVLAI